VFADGGERRWLEGLLLPLIQAEFERWRDERVAAGADLLVHEAPTLFEAGIENRYDTIVLVTAPRALRESRRPGSHERMAAQLPEEEKARRSDVVYENTGSLDELDRFVADLMERLR
jgi:dephospho-CoA kinase